MTTMTIQDFANCVEQWARQREPQMKYNWPVKGGWEGWVQVDLTAFILQLDSTEEILREQPIFDGSRMAVDLLLNADQAPAQQIAVEIKAQSWNNQGRFVRGVESDVEKLAYHRDAQWANAACAVLALAFTQSARDQVLALDFGGHQIFCDLYTGGEVACLLACWNYNAGWSHAEDLASEFSARTTSRKARAGSPNLPPPLRSGIGE